MVSALLITYIVKGDPKGFHGRSEEVEEEVIDESTRN